MIEHMFRTYVKKMCDKKNVLKCFRRVGVVNITDPEGGPTATGMILESSTAKKICRPPPPPPQVN